MDFVGWLNALATIKTVYTTPSFETKNQQTGLNTPTIRCPHGKDYLCGLCHTTRFVSPMGCVMPTKARKEPTDSAKTCPTSNRPLSLSGYFESGLFSD